MNLELLPYMSSIFHLLALHVIRLQHQEENYKLRKIMEKDNTSLMNI